MRGLGGWVCVCVCVVVSSVCGRRDCSPSLPQHTPHTLPQQQPAHERTREQTTRRPMEDEQGASGFAAQRRFATKAIWPRLAFASPRTTAKAEERGERERGGVRGERVRVRESEREEEETEQLHASRDVVCVVRAMRPLACRSPLGSSLPTALCAPRTATMDPSANVAAATNGVAPTAAAATPAAAAAAAAAPAPAPAAADLVRLQRRVADAPQDFDAHVSLVAETEKQKQPAAIRSAIRSLLEQFPLCFGYWQRLAKMELTASDAASPAAAQSSAFAVLEEGLRAVPHSHELWTFYVQEMTKSQLCTPDEIRRSDRQTGSEEWRRRPQGTLMATGTAAGGWRDVRAQSPHFAPCPHAHAHAHARALTAYRSRHCCTARRNQPLCRRRSRSLTAG